MNLTAEKPLDELTGAEDMHTVLAEAFLAIGGVRRKLTLKSIHAVREPDAIVLDVLLRDRHGKESQVRLRVKPAKVRLLMARLESVIGAK